MSDVWEDLQWRGLVQQVTDPALGTLLDEDFLTVYYGIDPTGEAGTEMPAPALPAGHA